VKKLVISLGEAGREVHRVRVERGRCRDVFDPGELSAMALGGRTKSMEPDSTALLACWSIWRWLRPGQSDATKRFDGEATGGAVTSGAERTRRCAVAVNPSASGNKETIDGAMLAWVRLRTERRRVPS